ncbi:UNVERIFIED_CONTAM: hypothetical protein K2H54_043847 [Gekko kuhli]
MLLQSVTRRIIRLTEKAQNMPFWGGIGFYTGRKPVPAERKEKEGPDQGSDSLDGAFDKASFKCPCEFTFPDRAIRIAIQRPEERSPEEVLFLRHVMRDMLSFRHYSNSMQFMLAQVVRYERFGKSRVVVRKGHRGDSFYFVFSGAISVTQDEDGSSALLDHEPILLKKGASFGEIALLKGLRRNATVVCVEETELLVVDKEDFLNNRLDVELQKELEHRFHFFRSLDLFSSLPDESLMALASRCKAEQFHHSRVVVSDTSKSKNIIFIVKGRCDVLRLLDLARCPSSLPWIRQQKALPGALVRDITRAGTGVRGSEPLCAHSSVPVPRRGDPVPALNDLPFDVNEPQVIQSKPAGGACAGKKTTDIKPRAGAPEESSEERNAGGNRVSPRTAEPLGIRNQAQTTKLSRSLPPPTYLCIDSLRPGEYFKGIDVEYIGNHLKKEDMACQRQECVWPSNLPVQMSQEDRPMVICSLGSEIIRIKLNMFCELADISTLDRMKKEIRPYPSDTDLCQIFLQDNCWKVFKQSLVHKIGRAKGAPEKRRPGERLPREESSAGLRLTTAVPK